MNIIYIVMSALAGILTALLYVIWLKASVKSLPGQTFSPLLVFGFLGRLILCAACFAAVASSGHFERLASCVIGFALTHAAAVILFSPKKQAVKIEEGSSHDNQPGQN